MSARRRDRKGCRDEGSVPVLASEIPVGDLVFGATRSRSTPAKVGGLLKKHTPSGHRVTITRCEKRRRAPRAAEGRVRGGAGLRPLSPASDAHDGRVRVRKRECRPDVHRRGTRGQRGPTGASVRGPGGQTARKAARGDRAGARRRVHRQHLEMPATGQSRSASERDRDLPGLSQPAGRADRAQRDLHPGRTLPPSCSGPTRPASLGSTVRRRCA